ncbi:MAG: Ig-like domain-containing protein, partial [Gammaproteobacteria bacterium]|nr:Ig-like domain-containing protein [Gammaproteobacteria bacterium]
MKKKIIAQICFCAVLLPLLIAGCGGSGGGTDESGGGGPTPQNQAPVAEDGTLAVTENQAASGTLEATDADGDALVFSIVGQPAHGSVAINDTTAGTYLYTPAPDYTGPDGFTFKANDGQADSNTASISITVEPASAPPPTTVNVALTVKEVAGVGASHYPVVAVVPLRYGTYYEADLAGFHVVDAAGDTVPSQIGIHNLWWARDRSIRMLDVHFEPTVGAYTAADTGISKYYFVYDTGLADPATPLTVQNVNGTVTVVTGPLKFITGKNPFHILDKVWLDKNGDGNFSDDELLLDAAGAGGGVLKNRFDNLERDALRNDVTVEVEEAGPIRVVLKAESPSRFTNISDMRSGFAVRIYAYAGKPFIRIDYQLQNAALNSAKSWPLYFKSLNLDFPLKPGNDPTVRIGLGAGDVYETAAGAPVVLQQRYLPNGGDQGE